MKIVVIGGSGLIGSNVVGHPVLEFFETSTRNLLAAEAAAGVTHQVARSVVGTERLSESGYFRAKQVREKLISGSTIPYSIVHATSFFEFSGVE